MLKMLRAVAGLLTMGAGLWAQRGPLDLLSLSPPSGSGLDLHFSLTVSDGNRGADVSMVGLYVTERFNAVRPGGACLVYYDRTTGEVRLADDAGGNWRGSAMRAGRPVGNSQCTVDAAESRVTVAGDRMTVEFAVRFAAGWKGSKLVYAYANSFGDTRNTGWKELGSWLVREEREEANTDDANAYNAPLRSRLGSEAAADPNDNPTKELDRSVTDYHKFLAANVGATELTHEKGVLRFAQTNGRRTAIAGPVTHQDGTGKWVANTPVLSETKQGWRVDGTSNGLIIRKKGQGQHEITQTYTDFSTKHDSTLTLTVPSLVYEKKQIFHFAKDGLTWDVTTDLTGAFNLAAKVATKRGKATYTFDVSSSEGLAVDAKGSLIGDSRVRLTRAMMYPKYGKAVACSGWTYSKTNGATFVCDDSGLAAKQLPYRIDPDSHTYTDTGTFYVDSWQESGGDSGSTRAQVAFNTSGLIGGGGSFVSSSCGYSVSDASSEDDANATGCSPQTFSNSGNTEVWVFMNGADDGGWFRWANVTNVSLTVNYNQVSVSVSPASATVSAGLTQQITATVTNSSAGVTWSINPNVGSVSSSGLYTAPATQASAQTVTVTATSVANSQATAQAILTVLPSVSISVAAGNAMAPSQMQQFTATVTNAANSSVTWSMVSGPGAINAAGWYTSRISVSGATSVTVRATSVVDPAKSATATITVNPWTAGAPYQYYLSDNFTSIDAGKWQAHGAIAGGSSGLTGNGGLGGSVTSNVGVPDGSSDYEVQMTVHLNFAQPLWGAAYSVLARATPGAAAELPDTATFYAFRMVYPWFYATGWSAGFSVVKVVNGSWTELASFPYACHDGMTMGMVVRGSSITVAIDSAYTYTLTDSSIASGKPGVSFLPMAGSGISNVKIGAIDNTAPGAVIGGSVLSSAFKTRVDLQWTAVADNTAGSGLLGYQVSRGGVVLGTTPTPQYTDDTAAAGSSVTYSVVAFDRHGNQAAAATKQVTVPSTGADQRRVGVRGTGSYWGAAGEQIDLLSGNLNFSLPLLGAKSRGGWGAGLMLSYNSQMWRQEGGASWKLGQDVGYGLGWRLQAGSIFPVWYNGSLLYCIFADATGAEYRLEQAGSSTLYTSKEGVYLTYDSAAGRVYFPDGSYWQMGSPSSGLEEDGGTMYPTSMGDTNGNVVVLNYLTGLGSVSLNSSARLSSIEDARAVGSYQFSYTAGTVPHLAAITNPIGTSEAYTFGYGITSALSPFEGSAPGAVVNLALGKAATQSSTYSDSTGAESAGKAVDGNTDGEYFDGSVSVTNHDTNAWWQVDLGAPAAVTNVQIWNMTNACCVTRVSNYWVFISDTPFLSTDTPATLANRVGTWSSYQATQPNPSVTIAAGGATGRYVRIQLAGTDYLNLAEVRVNGTALVSPLEGSAPPNLAQGKTATQSSTYSDSTVGAGSAGKAVDGNTDGEYFDGSVSVTNYDANAWWQVDLGETAAVSNVQIWNMSNACCVGRVSNYWVFISETPFLSTDTPSTLANRAGTWSSYQATQPNPSVTIAAGGALGRYVRIQLAGTNYLNLAEVRVIGSNTSVLKSVTTTGLGTAHRFGYNGSGEMTSMTTPLGGTLGWNYSTYAYTARSYREVRSRTMSAGFAGSAGMSNTWTITPDAGTTIHGSTTVGDSTASSEKQWWFETSAAATLGLATQFEERGPMGLPGAQSQGTIVRKNYTWATDANGNVYIGTVVSTANPGSGNPLLSKSVQTLDVDGNITQQQVYGYHPTTPALLKTYNFTYLTDSNYTSRISRIASVK